VKFPTLLSHFNKSLRTKMSNCSSLGHVQFMFGRRSWFEANLLIPHLCFGSLFEAVSVDHFSILFHFLLDKTELRGVLWEQLQLQIVIQSKQPG